jgi:hypothetical protein
VQGLHYISIIVYLLVVPFSGMRTCKAAACVHTGCVARKVRWARRAAPVAATSRDRDDMLRDEFMEELSTLKFRKVPSKAQRNALEVGFKLSGKTGKVRILHEYVQHASRCQSPFYLCSVTQVGMIPAGSFVCSADFASLGSSQRMFVHAESSSESLLQLQQ